MKLKKILVMFLLCTLLFPNITVAKNTYGPWRELDTSLTEEQLGIKETCDANMSHLLIGGWNFLRYYIQTPTGYTYRDLDTGNGLIRPYYNYVKIDGKNIIVACLDVDTDDIYYSYSKDEGYTWKQLDIRHNLGANTWSIWTADNWNKILITARYGAFYSTDGGETFRELNQEENCMDYMEGYLSPEGDLIWLINGHETPNGSRIGWYFSTDEGYTWRLQQDGQEFVDHSTLTQDPNGNLFRFENIPNTDLWDGIILKSETYGLSWYPVADVRDVPILNQFIRACGTENFDHPSPRLQQYTFLNDDFIFSVDIMIRNADKENPYEFGNVMVRYKNGKLKAITSLDDTYLDYINNVMTDKDRDKIIITVPALLGKTLIRTYKY